MSNTIAIFNPKDEPYGKLSNNSYHPMRIPISGKLNAATIQYPTVTNFIYSRIMRTPAFADMLSRLKPTKDVQTQFSRYYAEQTATIQRRSVEIALAAKFRENDNLKLFLTATGNAPIYYCSGNFLLGTGDANNGKNVYGQSLMALRDRLRSAHVEKSEEEAKQQQEQIIYDTYLAKGALKELLLSGEDLPNQSVWEQVSEFNNKDPSTIVNSMGRQRLQEKNPERQIVLKMAYKDARGDLVCIAKRPENLALQVLKNELARVRLVRLRQRKELIFDMYANYLLKKHYPTLGEDQFAAAKAQQFTDLPFDQRHDLENRLCKLYEEGMLSSTLSDKIDDELALLRVPSEAEVDEAESVELDYSERPVVSKPGWQPDTGEPILVYPVLSSDTSIDPKYQAYTVFSPVAIGMIRIDGRCFPTIAHYITFALLEKLPAMGTPLTSDAAYQQLLLTPGDTKVGGVDTFASISTVTKRFKQLEQLGYSSALQEAAKIGLDYKFKDFKLQALLVSTGDAELVWSDFSNPVLGVAKGDRPGSNNNFVGRYMMELRAGFKEAHKEILVDRVTTEDVSAVIDKDPFMQWWITMRVRDMCNAIIILKHHLWVKDAATQEISPAFVTTVLNEVYQPCSHLFGKADLVTAEAPESFTRIVRGSTGFDDVNQEVVGLLWKHVVVMVYYLVRHMKDATIQSIRTALGQIQGLLSKKVSCSPSALEDETDNCILSALLNLLVGIVTFNKQLSMGSTLAENDVHVAASIILNTDVVDQLKLVPDPTGSGDLPHGDDDDDDFDRKDPEFIIPGDADDTDDEGQYGSEAASSDDDGYSPSPLSRASSIVAVLKDQFPELEDLVAVARTIDAVIDTIKTHPTPSPAIKQNRINFFASLR
jgi:predicted NAD-dependent protein-ADP-ribosyltransferase YbiA (DUF1768 family)